MSEQKTPTPTIQELLGEGWLISPEHRARTSQVVRLEHAVQHGGQTLQEVTLGLLKGKHVRAAPSSWETHEALLRVAGLLSGLPDSVLDQLQGGDLLAVIDATMRLLWPIFELPAVGASLDGEARRPWPEIPSPYTLELAKVLRVGVEAVSSITFQPITGKLVRKLPNHLETKLLPKLVEGLTGLRPELFDELECEDLNRVLGVAQCFFGATRPTTRGPG